MGWVSADQFDEAAGAGGWRKGPWTSEEDKLLHHYVTLHGEGRWSSVARCAGLNRSGKSCRLRWVNYLRPGLKRGHITPQEEAIIIELHALWGNKWSTIARYLPGRTDNEIKNYWRTHFKKKERMIIGRRQKYQVPPRNLMPHPHSAGGNVSVEKYSSMQQPAAGSLQQQCVPTTVSQDATSSSNWSSDQSSTDGGLWDAIWNYINGPSTSPDYSIGASYSHVDFENPLNYISN